MLKDMCAKAQVSGYFTNNSLRAYGTTTLYCANLSEKKELVIDALKHCGNMNKHQVLSW